MRTLDLSPLFRSSIGFDHLESVLDTAVHGNKNQTSYPPYNIEVVNEDRYRITMAIAGFKQEDVEITSAQNRLTIIGQQQNDEDTNYLHRGIAARNFERSFQLADHVKIIDASLQDGLLHIELERELPETLKPRKIQINNAQTDIKSVADQVA